MRQNLIFILLWLFMLQSVIGCVFDNEETRQFYHHKPITMTQKRKAWLKAFPNNQSNDIPLLKMINTAAGPFNIKNAETKADSNKSWTHDSQGADWPAIFPECGGQRQTPINIITNDAVLSNLPRLKFKSYSKNHPNMDIVNNGHTVDILGPWGETGEDIPRMSGGPLTGIYILSSVHFHWGYTPQNGAEHLINSKSGALEMHFVHYRSDFPNISAALESNLPESLAVVGLVFRASILPNPKVTTLFKTLNAAVEGQIIYPAAFPLDIISKLETYYTYDGSLTTPSCNEVVRWLVGESPLLKVTPAQLNILKKFQKGGHPIQGIYRDVQPLNGRKVLRGRA